MMNSMRALVVVLVLYLALSDALVPTSDGNMRFLQRRRRSSMCSGLTGMSGCVGSDAWACTEKGKPKDYMCVTQKVNPVVYKEGLIAPDKQKEFDKCTRCIIDSEAMSPKTPFFQTDVAISATILPSSDLPAPVTDTNLPPPPPTSSAKTAVTAAKGKKWAIAGNLPKGWTAAARTAPEGRYTPSQYASLLTTVASSRSAAFKEVDKLGKITVECEKALVDALNDANNAPSVTMEEDSSYGMSKFSCPQIPAVYGYATYVYTPLNCAMRNNFPGNMVRFSQWSTQLQADILNLPAPSSKVYRAQYIPFDPQVNAVYVNGNFWSSTLSPTGLTSFLGGRSKLLTWTNVSGGKLPKECVKFAGEEEVLQLPYTCWRVSSITQGSTIDSQDLGKSVDIVAIAPVTCASNTPTDFW